MDLKNKLSEWIISKTYQLIKFMTYHGINHVFLLRFFYLKINRVCVCVLRVACCERYSFADTAIAKTRKLICFKQLI